MGSPPDVAFETIDLGFSYSEVPEFHGCGLLKSGEVMCWGRDDFGQASPPPGTYTAVVAGENLSVAITSAGDVVAWGWVSSAPFPSSDYVSVGGGSSNACGVRRTGEVDCLESELGALQWSRIAIHVGTACGIDEAAGVMCLKLLDGAVAEVLEAVPTGNFQNVCVGTQYACALDADGSVTCWGLDEDLQNVPPATYQQIDCGGDYACGVNTQGKINCWGRCLDPGVCDVPV